MQLNYLEVNGNLEEITCHGSPAFPMEVYLDNLDLYPNRFIPWHWHKELEFVYVLEGTIEFQAKRQHVCNRFRPGRSCPLNMLHMVSPYHRQHGSIYCAVLADSYLLHGLSGGLIEEQYISALFRPETDFFFLDRTSPWHAGVLACIHEMYQCDCSRPRGYLWKLQILVQQAGLILFENLDMKQEPCPSVHDSRYQRVRCCLEYIHKEYAGRLRLEDIARAANVSVSECCRDFKEVLSQSPVDYLISYRVRMGSICWPILTKAC